MPIGEPAKNIKDLQDYSATTVKHPSRKVSYADTAITMVDGINVPSASKKNTLADRSPSQSPKTGEYRPAGVNVNVQDYIKR